MNQDTNNPNQQGRSRNPDGTFPPGVSGNPKGRPKGSSMKEFWQRKFYSMTDEEKEAWCIEHKLSPDVIWKMSEGNPKQDTEVTLNKTMGDVLDELENGGLTTERQELED